MIHEPVLFVLGAGASVPFGFPTGPQLGDSIIAGLSQKDSALRRILLELGHDNESVDRFRSRFAASAVETIDQFLENNPQFLDLGSAAIAYNLVRCEDESRLVGTRDGNWYRLLAQQLHEADLRNDLIGFVTFNYDRSLEHFLFTAIKNRRSMDSYEAASFVNSLTIYHMYGKLGHLLWEKPPHPHGLPSSYCRPYGTEVTIDVVAGCVESLRIPHDPRIVKEPFKNVFFHLGDYKAIHFLGFGYDSLNLTRVGVTENHALTTLQGSAYGLSEGTIGRIEADYRIRLDRHCHPALEYLQGVVGWG
jgi:hypothetical protein